MRLTLESRRDDIPEFPDPTWVASLVPGAEVAVVDPTPRHVVYLAKVKRVTPSGLVRLVHNGGREAQTFRADGYQHVRRGWHNPWPRYVVSPEQPDAAAKTEGAA